MLAAFSALSRSWRWAGATTVALTLTPLSLSAQQAQPRDRFDPIKHVNLGSGGSVWVGFGGQFRERAENWSGFNFGAPPTADHEDLFELNRTLLSADFHFGERVRLFAQGKSSTVNSRSLAGGSTRASDQDELDLQQAYGEVRLPHVGSGALAVRVGRQDLGFGRERLVGPLDWANTRRTFEGYTASWTYARGAVNAFMTRPILVNRSEFNHRDSLTTFYGMYGTLRPAGTAIGVDAYWLSLNHRVSTFNGTTGREKRQTLGTRVWGPTRQRARLDYEVEAAYQFGTVGAGNIAAYMAVGQVGYNAPRFHGARLYLGVDYGSGDDTTGGDVGTYNVLFPTAHATLGFMDIMGRPNTIDLSGGGSIKLWRDLTGLLDVHSFRRAGGGDLAYGKAGAPLGGRSGVKATTNLDTLSMAVGTEVDLTLRYPMGRHCLLTAGYSVFSPGDFIKQTGPKQTVNFGYTALQFTL